MAGQTANLVHAASECPCGGFSNPPNHPGAPGDPSPADNLEGFGPTTGGVFDDYPRRKEGSGPSLGALRIDSTGSQLLKASAGGVLCSVCRVLLKTGVSAHIGGL